MRKYENLSDYELGYEIGRREALKEAKGNHHTDEVEYYIPTVYNNKSLYNTINDLLVKKDKRFYFSKKTMEYANNEKDGYTETDNSAQPIIVASDGKERTDNFTYMWRFELVLSGDKKELAVTTLHTKKKDRFTYEKISSAIKWVKSIIDNID